MTGIKKVKVTLIRTHFNLKNFNGSGNGCNEKTQQQHRLDVNGTKNKTKSIKKF